MSEADIYYLDTSALMPYYREEEVSRQINDLLISIQTPILISDLVKIEFASAVGRWARTGEITATQAAIIENTFHRDIASGLYLNQHISLSHFTQAEKWLSARSTSLRTLDALHLACSWSHNAPMITCDTILHDSAKTLGVESIYIHPDRYPV